MYIKYLHYELWNFLIHCKHVIAKINEIKNVCKYCIAKINRQYLARHDFACQLEQIIRIT